MCTLLKCMLISIMHQYYIVMNASMAGYSSDAKSIIYWHVCGGVCACHSTCACACAYHYSVLNLRCAYPSYSLSLSYGHSCVCV